MAKGAYIGVTQSVAIPTNTKGLFHFDGNYSNAYGSLTAEPISTVGFSSGKFNNGAVLNGSGCIRIPYSSDVNFGSGDFTIAGWFKRNTALNGTWQALFTQRGYYDESNKARGLTITLNSSNQIRIETYHTYSQGSSSNGGDMTNIFTVGKWVHVAVVRKGTTMTVYVNGVTQTSIDFGTNSIFNNSFPFIIGAAPVQSTNYLNEYTEMFDGSVDEFIIVKGTALWTSDFTPPPLAYGNTGGIARKIKKGYVGIDGIARKIKKAYIGIGGVARPCFGDGKPVYYGRITDLSTSVRSAAATSLPDYAIIAGGGTSTSGSSNGSTTVNAYSKSLVKTNPTNLSTSSSTSTGASIGNYALFAMGQFSSTGSTAMEAYDNSLTKQSSVPSRSGQSYGAQMGANDNYALVAGGTNDESSQLTSVTGYNASLTKSTPTGLSWGNKIGGSAKSITRVGNYIIVGYSGASSTTTYADCYNESLTKTAITGSMKYSDAKGLTMGDNEYGVFVNTTNLLIFDKALTYTTSPLNTSTVGYYGAVVRLGDYGLLGGGGTSSSYSKATNTVYMIDSSFTVTTTTSLAESKFQLSATSIGDYGLFCGGTTASNSRTKYVEAFKLS